jgi:hypothetical protein
MTEIVQRMFDFRGFRSAPGAVERDGAVDGNVNA